MSIGQKDISNISKFTLVVVEVRPTNVGRFSLLVFKNIETFICDDSGRDSTYSIMYNNSNQLIFKAVGSPYFDAAIFKIIGLL